MADSNMVAKALASRALRPQDLFDEDADGTPVNFSMRLVTVSERFTRAGEPWALLDGRWRGLRLRCLVFPTRWAATDHPSPGDAVVVRGQLSVREGNAVVWAKDLVRLSLV